MMQYTDLDSDYAMDSQLIAHAYDNDQPVYSVESAKLQYDLNGEGEYEVFPLQLGRTNYTVSLWRQVEGKKYGKIGQVKVAANMEYELSCFLYPNQYVNYKKDSPCVKEAAEICKGN